MNSVGRTRGGIEHGWREGEGCFVCHDELPVSPQSLHRLVFEGMTSGVSQCRNLGENVLFGTPTGCGKTICAESALLRLWSKCKQPRAICIEPHQEMVYAQMKEW